MQEHSPSNESLSPKDRYKQLFDQVMELASKYRQISPVFRNVERFDEDLSVVKSTDNCVFVFSTKEFNPASPESSEGSYPNQFTFNFDAETMSYSYTEAVPPRQQGQTFFIDDLSSEKFRSEMLPHFRNFNNLLKYFNLQDQVEIPR